MSCGKVTEEHIVSIQNSIHTAMKLWRGLDISVTPKLHAIEDHLAEQIITFSGIGDFCEDFIEKSHQDGIIDHSQTKNSMTQEAKASQHSHREHKQLLPSVRGILKEVNHNAKRYRTVSYQNGVQTKTLAGKHDKRKSKISEDKKSER
jgi:hypothetical protein